MQYKNGREVKFGDAVLICSGKESGHVGRVDRIVGKKDWEIEVAVLVCGKMRTEQSTLGHFLAVDVSGEYIACAGRIVNASDLIHVEDAIQILNK